MKILFVCTGNVGRSQIAEAIFNSLTKGKHTAVSAGTRVFDSEGVSQQGQKLHERESAKEVIESLKKVGFDVSNNQRDQVTKEMAENADRIVVMAEQETIPDFLINNAKVTLWTIEDPWNKDQQTTDRIRDEITEKVKLLIPELDKQRP